MRNLLKLKTTAWLLREILWSVEFNYESLQFDRIHLHGDRNTSTDCAIRTETYMVLRTNSTMKSSLGT